MMDLFILGNFELCRGWPSDFGQHSSYESSFFRQKNDANGIILIRESENYLDLCEDDEIRKIESIVEDSYITLEIQTNSKFHLVEFFEKCQNPDIIAVDDGMGLIVSVRDLLNLIRQGKWSLWYGLIRDEINYNDSE